MDDTGAPSNRLSIRTGLIDGGAATSIAIDGVDLLDLQRPTRRPDGSEYPDGPTAFLPANPVGLLPPDSAALLPTTTPRQAMVGVCTCGEPGCSSLWLQVRRDGDEVLWEPDPDTPSHTVDTSWRFALRAYLDALDEGQRSSAAWETRPMRIARELRRRRDSLDGFHMINPVTRAPMRLINAIAWPSEDYVLIEIASDIGPRQLHLEIDAARTDQEILWQLRSVDPVYDRVPPPATQHPGRDGVQATAAASGRGARIIVGTKNFTEQITLGQLYTQALRARGFDVALRANLGATEALSRVLEAGRITVYPEYTGVICADLAKLPERPRTARAAYRAASEWLDPRGYSLLEPSAFQTTGCVVVRATFAREHAVTSIADLSRLAHFSYGGSSGLAQADALRLAYGLGNFTFRPVAFGDQYRELDEGNLDAIACVSTDGQLANPDYLVLSDPEAIFGFSQVAPVVDKSLLATVSPAFTATLNEVTGLLSAEAMTALNKATDLDGTDPAKVAAAFLAAHWLLG